MSKIRKRFERILINPNDIKWDELRTIAEHYGLTVKPPSRGSHYKVYYENDTENTMVTVPVHHNRVKPVYVKRIISLIEQNTSEEDSL
ncbi:HicA-like toxin of HicAB toxin-antitoxin system [Anoxybacillus vitaminiphilus]|uniref:HicA-like toxin of HicAB toxin-antitoxin system n=1 Tax=Paranoxybacillus vitaminiphilus TaxID=581036 RepID=A0A327Y8B1_9BACL|nr:type II toxin-antitoxin system HicA family toxin [Anoxybacillus vitaminiphilus]RAK17368.1 HicA-like toxin of HicAB toxin-antitoxin system [Anoxybacillus vitaminiphilus]